MRVVYDNAVDRSTLTATAGVGTLVATNLLTDIKSEVWRTATTTAQITLTWVNTESVGCAALPFCSLSQTATMRVRGYTNAADATALFDTGNVLCSPNGFGKWNWGATPLGVNAYAYSGAAYGMVWFAHAFVKKLVIDIIDTGNTLGYIEAARVVTGPYWTPLYGADYGAQLSVGDLSKHERSDAGDLRTDRGAMFKKVSLDLSYMPAEDRNVVWDIARTNGMSKPLLFSLSPTNTDTIEDQMFQVYGKLSQQSALRYQFMSQFSTSIELEEI